MNNLEKTIVGVVVVSFGIFGCITVSNSLNEFKEGLHETQQQRLEKLDNL